MAPSGAPTRILAIHRYFWPDTPPYASLLRAIVGHWVEAGHRVEVLTSQPSYKAGALAEKQPKSQSVDGVIVHRIDMVPDSVGRFRKPRNMARFSLLVALRVLFGKRRDLVMCSTAPQVLLGWAVSLAARIRGAAFVYHCMDLHPEIGRLSGEFANPLLYRLLLRLDTTACRRAAAIVVLSDDMRAALIARDPALADKVVVINNFDLPEYGIREERAAAPIQRDPERLTLAFTGNIGRYQGLETIAAAVLGDDDRLERVRFVLMGEGAAKGQLDDLVSAAAESARDRLVLLPHGSPADARAVMREADLGLVSLVPDVIRYAYPSKTASYLSEGLPILAAVEPDSALARDVERLGVGGLLPVDTAEAARKVLLDWLDRRDELPALRKRATQAWHDEFSEDLRLRDWDALLDNVIRRKART